jgi:hypothetical protein
MKIIYSKTEQVRNRATSVTASSEDADYPATNLLLGNVSKPFRSATGAAPISTITLNIAVPVGITSGFGIFGCNSTSIAYAIKDVTETTTYFSGTLDTTPASPARTFNRAWFDWTSNGQALHIILTLTAPTTATYHEVGEIVVCDTVDIPDPQYGLGQSRENFQVVQELAGGGIYVHDGAKPRTFDLGWVMLRETEFDDLDEIYEEIGQNPVGMLISENAANDLKWCGYFHMTAPPKASHDYPNHSVITLPIREAV